MAAFAYGTNHSVISAYVEGDVQPGDVLCHNAGETRLVVATTANLGSLKPEGVAMTAGDSNHPVQLCTVGPIRKSITGLLPGSASYARVSAAGHVERVASPGPGDVVIGWIEATGHFKYNLDTASTAGGGASPGGANGDIQYRIDAATFGGMHGTAPDQILRFDGSAWQVAAGILVPAGANNDVVGLDGAGALKSLGPMSSGTPGGSDNQGQYNNGGAFGGMSGLLYDEATNRPQLVNGWYLSSGANRFLFAGTPSAARTITFQDATHTIVGRDTVDTLTNKGINLTDNTVSATGAAQYDIIIHNGTKFVPKSPTANRIWGTNGSNQADYFQLVNAMVDNAAAIAGSKIAPDFGAQLVQTTGKMQAGHFGPSGTLPAAGIFRIPYNGGVGVAIITAKDAVAGDVSYLTYGASNAWTLGNTGQDNTVTGFITTLNGAFSLEFAAAGAGVMSTAGVDIKWNLPHGGNTTNPFRVKQATITYASANKTLSTTEQQAIFLTLTGTTAGARDLIAPDVAGSLFNIKNTCGDTITLKKSGGSGVAIATAVVDWYIHTGTDYERRGV